MADQFIRTNDDLLKLLDALLAETSDRGWWDGFFADRSRRCPLPKSVCCANMFT